MEALTFATGHDYNSERSDTDTVYLSGKGWVARSES